ncbi:unnamed protein product [Lampetra fluviatilis]
MEVEEALPEEQSADQLPAATPVLEGERRPQDGSIADLLAAVFHRRFTVTCTMAGWTDSEALRALPTTLDDDALAAFFAIPTEDRTMLQESLTQLAGIFDPPSNMHHRFAAHRWGEARTQRACVAGTGRIP